MKKIVVLVLLLSSALLNALDYLPGSGDNVGNAVRDSLLYYHNNTDDHHWYGADSWAVKFDFDNYFSNVDSIQFSATNASVFIPNTQSSDDMTVKLCRNIGNQPQLEPSGVLYSQTIQPGQMNFQDWNEIEFNDTYTDSILWIVIDYPTNPEDQFISASAIGGANSYYFSNDYYYNMLANGFESEFLVSLQGSFLTEGNDLDLVSLEWQGQLTSNAMISPSFTIINNSISNIENSYIKIVLENPLNILELQYSNGTVCDSILLPTLNAESTTIIDVSDSLFYELARDPAQYSVEADLYSISDSLFQNNSVDSKFNTFNKYRDQLLVENIVRSDNSSSNSIFQIQENIISTNNCKAINYFSNPSDLPFYSIDSFERFHFYDLMGYPATIIDGADKIIGYLPTSYSTTLSSYYNVAIETKRTFIDDISLTGLIDQNNDVEVEIEIENTNTHLFESFITDSYVFAVVIENVVNVDPLPVDVNVPVMLKKVGEIPEPDVTAGHQFQATVNFNLIEDLQPLTEDLDNCEVVVWFQNIETKNIYGVSSIPFAEFTLTDCDDLEISNQKMEIRLSKNPFDLNNELKISLTRKADNSIKSFSIYNIKGQVVESIRFLQEDANYITWDGRDLNEKKVANGIYFMKIVTNDNDAIFRKFMVMKK